MIIKSKYVKLGFWNTWGKASWNREISFIVNTFSCIPYNFKHDDRNRMCRVNPEGLSRASKEPVAYQRIVCRLFLAFVHQRCVHNHYIIAKGPGASLWKDERLTSAFGVSRGFGHRPRVPFRLTSDKRPEGSQRRFHESYWQGRKTERRDVVGMRAPRTRRRAAPAACAASLRFYQRRSSSLFTPF